MIRLQVMRNISDPPLRVQSLLLCVPLFKLYHSEAEELVVVITALIHVGALST